jgi:hypothetical protein
MPEERHPDKVFVGSEGRGYVAIEILNRDKEGWMTAAIEVFADVWRGAYRGDFYPGELSGLALSLECLYVELKGIARSPQSKNLWTLPSRGMERDTL